MSDAVSTDTLSKWRRLVRALDLATSEGKVKWKPTAESSIFLTTVNDTTVVLSAQGQDYVLEIVDGSDAVVDRFSDVDLDRGEGGVFFSLMKNLYQRINREASGADEILDDLINSLPNPDEIPF